MKEEEFYGPADLICGKKVEIYGRECLIFDCDQFTKDWYAANMGIEQKPVKLAKPLPNFTY